MNYRYQLADEVDNGEFDPQDGYTFESDRVLEDNFDAERLAEEMAADYRNHHGGWEASWPITIAIFREDETFVGMFTVDVGWIPSYSAAKIQGEKGEK